MSKAPILLVTTLFLLSLTSPCPAAQVWPTDFDAAKARAAAEDRLIVVDLFAEWCGWCHVLERDVFGSEEFARFAADLVLVRLDVEDGAEGSRVQAQYDAMNLPTTLILNAGGVVVGRVEGFAPAAAYIGRMKQEIAVYRRLEETFERVTGAGAKGEKTQRLMALAEAFHQRLDGRRAVQLYRLVEGRGWEDPAGGATLPFRLADALRLVGEYEEAAAAASRARRLAAAAQADPLVEAIDLLDIQIADGAGDCQERRQALEAFLRLHPTSRYHSEVTRSLQDLESGADGKSCSS